MYGTWYLRRPFGIFCVWPTVAHACEKTSMMQPAALMDSVSSLSSLTPLPNLGTNIWLNWVWNLLALNTCACCWMYGGSAHIGTALLKVRCFRSCFKNMVIFSFIILRMLYHFQKNFPYNVHSFYWVKLLCTIMLPS